MPRHLLQLEGLEAPELTALLDRAEAFIPAARGEVSATPVLAGRLVANLFFEDSTRTRLSFEAAAARLGARAIALQGSGSSTSKGETFLDTALNVEALGVDAIVVRTNLSGGPNQLARHVQCAVINAGDGRHEHPTQGLLDCLTIRKALGAIKGANVAIVGDIANSRVARSALHALTTLGCAEVRVVGPQTLVPADMSQMGVKVFHNLEEGIKNCDVIITLRLQNERMSGALLPSSQEYFKRFGLTPEKLQLAKPDAIVMHPGPINRGVEIDTAVVAGPQSVILPQVTFGIAVRMAVMSIVAGNEA